MPLNEPLASGQESGRSSQMKARQNAQELRSSLLQRRQNDAVRLRKQKREERLQTRRMASVSSNSISPDAVSVEGALKAYLSDQIPILSLHQTLSNSDPNTVNTALDTLVNRQPDQAEVYASRLVKALQQSNDINLRRPLYDLLLAATASQKFSQNLSQSEDSYYGSVPRSWSDVLLDIQGGTFIALSVDELVKSPNPSSIINLLGNLVQNAGSSAIRQVLLHWPAIIQLLPTTSYLCAAVAQHDATSLGLDLLQPQVSMPRILSFFQSAKNADDPSCLVDIAWFLEGVTRRESGVAEVLWDPLFVQSLSVVLDAECRKGNQAFVYPICRMIGNIAEASNGDVVPLIFASPLYTSLQNLLGQGTVLEVVPTVAALLVDAGTPNHPSTKHGISDLVPTLWKILVMPPATVGWKSEAVMALLVAMTDPPNDMSPPSSEENTVVKLVWNMSQNVDRVVLFRSILSLIRVPNQRVSLAALQLFDKLLRNIQSCKEYMEDDASFSDCLNEICNNNQGSDEARAELAADLLDDFFEGEGDEEEPEQGVDSAFAFATEGGSFRFGIPEAPTVPTPPMASEQPRPMGRGRGRPVPSWMTKK